LKSLTANKKTTFLKKEKELNSIFKKRKKIWSKFFNGIGTKIKKMPCAKRGVVLCLSLYPFASQECSPLPRRRQWRQERKGAKKEAA